MKKIDDIFAKSNLKNKKQKFLNQKIPIIIDTREKQSLIASNLSQKKANIKFEKLEIGDYLIKNTIIERKTFQDFVGSMINKRLVSQLKNLKTYSKYFLIIEGFDYKYSKFNVHENAIRGMLISIATDFQIPIIYTKDEEDTSNFLILTAKKYERSKINFSKRPSKTHSNISDQKKFILEGFPGVGPTISKNLLEKFKSLNNIFNVKKEDLEQIKGFNESKINKFKEILGSKF
tara:strand:+ start:22639 stop:23337 length:699 start_codon:yes stop_codon:yes gene_type:complete